MFRIDPFRGELFTTTAHAFNDKSSYAITITATDPSAASDSITITLMPSGGGHNPVVSGPEDIVYPENGTWQVAEYLATTADQEEGYTHGWLVSVNPGGGDGDFFRLDDDGRLTFIQPPDFENPADEGADNTYEFSIEIYHTNTPVGKPRGHTVGINVTVTVVDVPNEALEIDGPSAVRYAENGTEPVANYSLDDVTETVQWVLSGDDGNEFNIGADGALTFNELPDYENPTDTDAKNDYLLTITAYTLTDAKTEFIRVQVTDINESPAFDEGETATREVEPDAALNSLVGAEVTATDPDVGDYPSYSLPDAATLPFAISEFTGQLSVDGAIEANRASYPVVVLVTDNADADDNYDATADDRITVTVNVAGGGSSNNAPEFPAGVLSFDIDEKTATVVNVGTPVTATDDDTDDTLTYSLGGTDAGFFTIGNTSGQIQTKANQNYDFETKPTYSVTVTADDDNGGTADKAVTITLNNVEEDGTVTLSPTQPAARSQVTATLTDPDEVVSGTTTWQWERSNDGKTDWANVGTNSDTYTPVDGDVTYYLRATASYTDGEASGKTAYAVSASAVQSGTNRAPTFDDGQTTTRDVAEGTAADQPVGAVVKATDQDSGDTLVYSMIGTDAGSFTIDTGTGHVKVKTGTTLDYEAVKNSYTVIVQVHDGKNVGGTPDTAIDDSIIVTINVTDANEAPGFDSATAARSIAENSAENATVGATVTANDPDASDTLTYSLSGTDASSFTIDSTGQIKVGASPTLDYESAKKSYSVTVEVRDRPADTNPDATIAVTITVTDVNEEPEFPSTETGARSIAENSATDANIGPPVAATDPDTGDTLTYTLDGPDSASFSIDGTSGQLKTKAALNKEADDTYSVTVAVRDSKNDAGNPDMADDATITVTITVTDANEPPTITGTSNVSYAENRTDALATYTATDPEGSTNITWSKSGDDADDFSINAGVLTFVSPPNFEGAADDDTDNVYLVTVVADDGSGNTASVEVTINVTDVNEPPEFDDRPTTTREVAENTGTNQNIGNPVAATDPDDGDTLIYSLDSTSATSFSIDTSNGQLKTKAALNKEATATYTVTVSVKDRQIDANPDDTIIVTITVTDANEPPEFPSTEDGTRSFPENTGANVNVGSAVTANDPDTGATLTYTLEGADAASFEIDDTNGQIKTKTGITYDHETTPSYSVTVTADDSTGGTATKDVTINVTDVNEAPEFPSTEDGARSIAENTLPNMNVGAPITATDPDNGDTLTYSLRGTDADSFNINTSTGQLQTKAAPDFEDKPEYYLTVWVRDNRGDDGTADTANDASIPVTISVTDVNEPPAFPSTEIGRRNVDENSSPGSNIGVPVGAIDPEGDSLTYTLDRDDEGLLSIDGATGQIRMADGVTLDHETTPSYTVIVSVSDSKDAHGNSDNITDDTVTVTITVADGDEPPVLTGQAAVSYPENGDGPVHTYTGLIRSGRPLSGR